VLSPSFLLDAGNDRAAMKTLVSALTRGTRYVAIIPLRAQWPRPHPCSLEEGRIRSYGQHDVQVLFSSLFEDVEYLGVQVREDLAATLVATDRVRDLPALEQTAQRFPDDRLEAKIEAALEAPDQVLTVEPGLSEQSILAIVIAREPRLEDDSEFDGGRYWSERLERAPSLVGTGTAGRPASWQQWMYRAKERAFFRALTSAGVRIRGARVLNFGCGTGYFEQVWERHGASAVSGLDIVAHVVADLRARHPQRWYAAGDLSEEPELLGELPPQDLVTMIDVAYHVVDDARLERVLDRLMDKVASDGHIMLTDMLYEPPGLERHVRFRTLGWWKRAFEKRGFKVAEVVPALALSNRSAPGVHVSPWVVGALQYFADEVVLRAAPRFANNWVVVGQRS